MLIPAADNGSLSAVAFLSGLASRTGGEYIAVAQQDVPNVLSKIVIALRNMYFLGYTPSNSPRDGGYRSLQVSIEPPRGLPPLTVHYRPGRVHDEYSARPTRTPWEANPKVHFDFRSTRITCFRGFPKVPGHLVRPICRPFRRRIAHTQVARHAEEDF